MIISDMIVMNLNIYFIVLFIIDYIYIYILFFFKNKIKQKNEKPLVKIWISHEGIIGIKPLPSLTPAYA